MGDPDDPREEDIDEFRRSLYVRAGPNRASCYVPQP